MSTQNGQHNLASVKELAERYRNWGKWGPDDQLGTVNYITEQKVIEAAGLVRKGKVFSLALPLDASGPMTGAYGRVNPVHVMLQDGGDIASGAQDHFPALRYTDDAVYLVLQCATQWDALAHIYHEGKMYNGYGTEAVNSTGANKNSITNVKDKMVSRGVLLDIARYKGKPWLDVSEPIENDDLAGCAEHQGVAVGEGDIVLVRTGRLAYVRQQGKWGDEYSGGPAPGLAISVSEFLCERHVAAIATDTWGIEVLPNETADVFQPLHIILLVNAGIHIGEMFDLEALAEDCAADGVWDFMFVAPPLTVTGSVGSAINPQAIK
jgi:kynurenine formamidase